MLDLQPRVHLEEIEAAVLVEQELDGAGVGVADRAATSGSRGGDRRASVASTDRRRALLEHLLVTPLDGALALDERHDRAVLVAEQLDLDVARPSRAGARGRPRASPNAVRASDRAARTRAGSSSGRDTMRMPLPPPPATALSISG